MRIGDQVAEFVLPDQQGISRTLSEFLARGPLVIFFYPAAMTKGCTAESCHFRDLTSEFAAVRAQCIGISRDAVGRQAQFSALHGLDYPLLSDAEGVVASAFGVARSFGPLPVKRWTFVIAEDGRLLEIVKSETRMHLHADRALEVLRARAVAP